MPCPFTPVNDNTLVDSVKTTMVTLLGLPHITISVITLHKMLPNIMDLPFVSGFISSAIDTAAAEYVAPKSLTLDLQRLISGDDIKKDTDAIGILVVHIHRAQGVKRMDASGSSGACLIRYIELNIRFDPWL